MFNLAASLHIEFVIYCFTSTHFYLPTHHQHSSATCLECSVATRDTVTHHFLMDEGGQSLGQFYNYAIFMLNSIWRLIVNPPVRHLIFPIESPVSVAIGRNQLDIQR